MDPTTEPIVNAPEQTSDDNKPSLPTSPNQPKQTPLPPATEKAPVNWHPFHSDPVLDVVLVSKDGVYFRASSHALERESALFSNMLSNIPNLYQTPSDAIPLDYSGNAIAIFLDAYTTGAYSYKALSDCSLSLIDEYCKLIRFLDCDRYLEQTEQTLKAACKERPAEWLILASWQKDTPAAESALLQCKYDGRNITNNNIHPLLSQVRPTWRYPLLKLLLCHNGALFRVAWPDVGHTMDEFAVDVGRAEAEHSRE